jgi:hypothetical protein
VIVLVSDTSVLIDLERGGLLETAFACGNQLVVPDYLYVVELASENGPLLLELGLNVVELTSEEVEFAQTTQIANPVLTMADCFALSCARRPEHVLLTGDKALRIEAKEQNMNCYGLLWLLDQMEASKSITLASLVEGLEKISVHPRCRLPKIEVEARLKRWSDLMLAYSKAPDEASESNST